MGVTTLELSGSDWMGQMAHQTNCQGALDGVSKIVKNRRTSFMDDPLMWQPKSQPLIWISSSFIFLHPKDLKGKDQGGIVS